MSSHLPAASLGAAAMLALTLQWSFASAQPAPAAPAASQQVDPEKLMANAFAAYNANSYSTAIALFEQAYRHRPHAYPLFYIGLANEAAGNLSVAEKHYNLYLACDPSGELAPHARTFLSSRPNLPPVACPLPTAAPSPASSSTASAKTTPASNATRTPEQAPSPAAGGARVITRDAGERRPEPRVIDKPSSLPPPLVMRTAANTHAPRAPTETQLAISRKDSGFALMALGAVAGAGSIALAYKDQQAPAFGAGMVAVASLIGGVAMWNIGEERLRAASPSRDRDEDVRHARASKYTRAASVLLSTGLVLGITTIGLAAQDHSATAFGAGVAAIAVGIGGVGLYAHGASLRQRVQSVAWSPVVGDGFAGVALAGALP
jgi:hypothetical protein